MSDNFLSSDNYISLKHNPLTASLAKVVLNFLNRDVKVYIFVATTGRSGTASLERILAGIKGCTTHHEVYPIMHDDVMTAYNYNNPRPARNTYNYIKSINIKRTSIGYQYYAETNHMFIKSFIDFAAKDLNDKMAVIHLIRDPVSVAQSITNLGHEPGTDMGNKWYIDYRAPKNLIKIADDLEHNTEFKNPFYKSLWYWYEIEARVEFWQARLKRVRFFDLLTNDLNDQYKLMKLFSDMGIDYTPEAIANVASTRENEKKAIKMTNTLDRQQALDMHEKFQRLLLERGYTLPVSLKYFSNATP